jgi:hypothetical protein
MDRDILEHWKTRLHLDRKRGVQQRFALPLHKKPGVVSVQTRALDLAEYLLSYPEPTKGWTPCALAAVEQIRHQNLDISAIVTTSPDPSALDRQRGPRTSWGVPGSPTFATFGPKVLANKIPLPAERIGKGEPGTCRCAGHTLRSLGESIGEGIS